MYFFRRGYFDITSFLIVFSLLLIFDVPFNQALLATSIVGIQLRTGLAIFQSIFRTSVKCLSQFFSFGFTFGMTASSLSIVIFQETLIASLSWCIPSLVMLAIHFFRRSSSPESTTLVSSIEARELQLIFLVTSCFLFQDFQWMIYFIIPSLVSLALMNTRDRRVRLRSYAIVAFLFTTFTILFLIFNNRDTWWWFISDDFQFFEALQVSVSKFGIRDQFGVLGENWFGYHIVLFIWSGSIDTILGSLPFVTLTQIVPPVVTVYLSSSIISFFSVGRDTKIPGLTPLIVCIPFLFFYSFTSPTWPLGLAFLVSFLNLLQLTQIRKAKYTQLLALVFIGLATVFSKLSNLPYLLIIAFSIFVSSFWFQGGDRRRRVLLASVVAIAPSIVIVVFGLTSHVRGGIGPSAILGFSLERFGSLSTVNPSVARYFLGFIVTTEYFVIPIFGILGMWLFLRSNGSYSFWMWPICLLFAFCFSLVSGGGAYGYFVATGIFLTYLLSFLALSEIRHGFSLTLATFVIGISYTFLINHLIDDYFSSMRFWDLLIRFFLYARWPFLLVVLLICCSVFGFRRILFSSATLFLSIVFTLGSSVSSNPAVLGNPLRGSQLNRETYGFSLGTPEVIGVSEWIRSNSPHDAIFASNYFCDNTCVGSEWITSSPELAGSNFLLPALSNRRFYIQGTRFIGGTEWPNWVLHRMKVTTGYPSNQTFNGRQFLAEQGIDYFVIDKAGIDLSADSKNNMMFENDRFAIISISPNIGTS